MDQDLSGGDVGQLEPPHVKETRRQRWCEKNVPIHLRPIRLMQLILDVMLFSLVVHLSTRPKNLISTVASVMLMILFASFAILMSIDAAGQIGGCLTPDLPMFVVTLLGLVLFTSAAQAVYFFVYQTSKNSSTLVLILLCLVAALLFLLDATMMIMFWRYTYVKKGRCLPCLSGKSLTTLYQRSIDEHPSEPFQKRLKKSNPMTRDVSTSVSRQSVGSFYSGIFSSRSKNRIGVEHRREYVDVTTDPRPNTSLILVETQTEKVESTERIDREASTNAIIEEKQVQTLSECPICSTALDQSPKGICPSFLALIQSIGMFPCERNPPIKLAAACLVDRGTLPGSNSSLQAVESTIMVTKRPPRVYETRACPTHGAGLRAQRAGLPNPVTRVSLSHSIRKNKKIQTPTSKPITVKDEYQNTEIDEKRESSEQSAVSGKIRTQDSSVFVDNSILHEELDEQEDRAIGSLTSSENSPMEEGSSGLVKIDKTIRRESRNRRSFPSLAQGVFIMQRSSDNLSIPTRDSGALVSIAGTKDESMVISSSFDEMAIMTRDISTSPEDIGVEESNTSTGTPPIRPQRRSPQGTLIRPFEIGSLSTDSRDLTSPTVICPCPQYYYKDVFGRYICGQCAHKHLIKIPQRLTVKPVGNMRCCSCSQAIIYQTPNAEQKKCGPSCNCKNQTHRDSR